MIYFADSDNTVALAAIGLAGTLAAGFFALLTKLFRSIDENTTAHGKVADAINKGNEEAKDRNGHLAELVIQQGEQVKAIADTATDTIIKTVQNVSEQHIEHAHIEHETVEDKK